MANKQRKKVSDSGRLQQLTIGEKLCTNICKDFWWVSIIIKNDYYNNQFTKTRSLWGGGGKEQKELTSKTQKRKKKKKNKAPEKTLLSCKDHDGPGDQICASVAGR